MDIINPTGKQTFSLSRDFCGKKLTIEVNRVGFRTTSSVLVTYGDTVVLGSVVVSEKPVVQDFFPLSIDYEEKFYASGKISSSKFIKREGKPADEAILVGRLIDRPIRPLFPKGYRQEVQVVTTVLSMDPSFRPDMVAMVAASSALLNAGVPFDGPIAGVRIGRVNGEFKAFLSPEEREASDLDLVVAVKDDKVFSLLYEPDDKENWTDNDNILAHANPLALEIKEMWQDLLTKRQRAIEVESARENFLTKHCNIIYQGIGTESYIDINLVKKCSVKEIDWTNKRVWLGVDLAQTNDNCAVAIAGVDDNDNILATVMAFIPEGRIDEKSKFEHVDYRRFVEQMKCIACGDMVVDYGVIEDFVLNVEVKLGCEVVAIGYDRYNAMSSAQKWNQKYTTVEIRQHSDTLHPPTKLLAEKVENGQFRYEANTLLEINFENAKCTYDTNMNRYVNKKKSSGKVDMVVALINAIYLLQQDIIFNDGFVVQVV